MIVATTSDDVQFYSNDGQLFSDGEVTIYSPACLPRESRLTSNNLRVCTTRNRNGITVQATDADSGHVFWTEEVPSAFEAGQLSVWLFVEFYSESRS